MSRQTERLDLQAHVDRDPFEETEDGPAQRPGNSIQQVFVACRLHLVALARRICPGSNFLGYRADRACVRVPDDHRSYALAAHRYGHHDVEAFAANDGATADEAVHLGDVEGDCPGEHCCGQVDHRDLLSSLAALAHEFHGGRDVDVERPVNAGVRRCRVNSGRGNAPRGVKLIHRPKHSDLHAATTTRKPTGERQE